MDAFGNLTSAVYSPVSTMSPTTPASALSDPDIANMSGETDLTTPPFTPYYDNDILAAVAEFPPLPIPGIPSRPRATIVGDVAYSAEELRIMADQILEGRRAGDLPGDKFRRLTDAATIVEDFGHLEHLRYVRGDPAQPPSQEYLVLLANISKKIKAREAELEEGADDEEIARRVLTYMRGAEKEKEAFDRARGYLEQEFKVLRNNDDKQMEEMAEEVFSVIENAMLDSAGPLRLNINRLEAQLGTVDNQMANLDMHMSKVDSQLDIVNGQIKMFDNQIETLDTMLGSQVVAIHDAATAMDNTIAAMNSKVAQLPDVVRQAVQEAVNQALGEALEARFGGFGGSVGGNQVAAATVPRLPKALDQAIKQPVRGRVFGGRFLAERLIGLFQRKRRW